MLPFRTFFVTISATTRFSKMCTAPTQEHDFQGSNLSQSVHFGTLFSLIFQLVLDPLPDTILEPLVPTWSPKSLIFGPPLEPTGFQNSTQNEPRAPKNSAESAARAPKVIFGILGSSGDSFGNPLWLLWEPFGTIWGYLGSIGDTCRTIWDAFGARLRP